MRSLPHEHSHAGEEISPEAEIPYTTTAVLMLVCVFLMFTLVDTRRGNQEVTEDQLVINKTAGYQAVEANETVLSKDELNGLKDDLNKEKQRAEDAERFAQALGTRKLNGSPVAVVVIVDITMPPAKREGVKRFLRFMQAEKVILLACGDRLDATQNRFRPKTPETIEQACERLDAWPQTKERRLLDALDAAIATPGATRIVLCLAGMPTGSTAELLAFVKRRKRTPPINTIDFSAGDVAVADFLDRLSKATGGATNHGR